MGSKQNPLASIKGGRIGSWRNISKTRGLQNIYIYTKYLHRRKDQILVRCHTKTSSGQAACQQTSQNSKNQTPWYGTCGLWEVNWRYSYALSSRFKQSQTVTPQDKSDIQTSSSLSPSAGVGSGSDFWWGFILFYFPREP